MNWVLLGASRGLGKSFAEVLRQKESQSPIYISSRSSEWKMNFAQKEKWPEYLQELASKKPGRLLYFAGGGPYGNYSDKEWKDHEWAFRVNFEFPAFLIHQLEKFKSERFKQLCIVGSSVAESKPDPGAASYSAAKHALNGLVKSLHQESSLSFDLRLFSPGYMDTKLLPENAWPRQRPDLVQKTGPLAAGLYEWLLDDSKINSHLVITSKS